MTPGYLALRESAAWLDLRARGRIRARGEDRARLLHAMSTNHVEQLKPGNGCYAFFLNAQGRILSDVTLLCLDDCFLLDVEPETGAKLFAHLDKHIIADDVTLEDASTELVAIDVEGPAAAAHLARLGAPAPEADYASATWGDRLVARLSATGAPGWRIYLPAGESGALLQSLDLPAATAEDQRIVRLEHGLPRYGEDILENHLVQETRQMHAVHFTKGCYLGQEIVERVRSRGAVHKGLARLRIDSATAPAAGAEVLLRGEKVGVITSAAFSPALNVTVALGYIRTDLLTASQSLTVAEFRAEVTADARGSVEL